MEKLKKAMVSINLKPKNKMIYSYLYSNRPGCEGVTEGRIKMDLKLTSKKFNKFIENLVDYNFVRFESKERRFIIV